MISNVERTHKKIKKAGVSFLYDIFSLYHPKYDILSAEDAFKIFNTLGISLEYIILLANMRLMKVDEQGFLESS